MGREVLINGESIRVMSDAEPIKRQKTNKFIRGCDNTSPLTDVGDANWTFVFIFYNFFSHSYSLFLCIKTHKKCNQNYLKRFLQGVKTQKTICPQSMLPELFSF